MTIAKIFRVNLGRAVAAVDGDDDARCGPYGFHFIKYASVSLCICLFFQHPVLTPALLLPPQTQIDFEDQKINDIGNDCLMSIDGTDFQIPQTGEAKTGNWFASHKYSFKSALHYEIGVSIIWGDWFGINIFNKVLRHFLEPGERVEADNGYVCAADKIKSPDNPCNPVENEGMQSRARYHHETINGRFKTWGILQQTYRHDIRRHGKVFWAIAIMTQLAISNGSPLFSVEYED
jgi:hypothetical protein